MRTFFKNCACNYAEILYTTTEADFWPTHKQNKYFCLLYVCRVGRCRYINHYVNGILPYKLAPNMCFTNWQISNARNSIKNVVWHSFHIVFWSPWADVSFAPINFQNLLIKITFFIEHSLTRTVHMCVHTHNALMRTIHVSPPLWVIAVPNGKYIKAGVRTQTRKSGYIGNPWGIGPEMHPSLNGARRKMWRSELEINPDLYELPIKFTYEYEKTNQ